MKRCPYCAEEIQEKAIKCKHCNEFLDKSSSRAKKVSSDGMIEYNVEYKNTWDNEYVFAKNEEEAVNIALNKFRSRRTEDVEQEDLKACKSLMIGKFSCPKCNSKFTTCEKEAGCFFWLIGILTLGLLLAVLWPMLPHTCHCRFCGHNWKA